MHNSVIYSIVCKMAKCFTLSTLLGRKEITMYDSESSFWHYLKCIDPDSIPGFILDNHTHLLKANIALFRI